ncbi:MAG: SET domain-containing protein-lysine N-methyltransferase [Phycisphaerales bacterium JB041]
MKTTPERAGSASGADADEPPPQYSTIRIAESAIHGRGVFARRTIRKGEVVIVNPALPLGEGEVRDEDLIARYCFEWPKNGDGRALALGEASLLNHAPDGPADAADDGRLYSNLRWRTDTRREQIVFTAFRTIEEGEECLIDYGEDYKW